MNTVIHTEAARSVAGPGARRSAVTALVLAVLFAFVCVWAPAYAQCPIGEGELAEGSGLGAEGASEGSGQGEPPALLPVALQSDVVEREDWASSAFGCGRGGFCAGSEEGGRVFVVVGREEERSCAELHWRADEEGRDRLVVPDDARAEGIRIAYGTPQPPTLVDWTLFGPRSCPVIEEAVLDAAGRIVGVRTGCTYARCGQRLSVVGVTNAYTVVRKGECGSGELAHWFHDSDACEAALGEPLVREWAR